MTTYISLLRGINVSGQKLIKMQALEKTFQKLECEKVKTYLQSGNVIFTSNATSAKELEKQIEQEIKKDFGFDVPVLVLTETKLRDTISNNPFINQSDKDIVYMHITFLGSIPENIDVKSLESKKLEGEEIFISEDIVYLYCPNGYGKTKLTNNFFESKLKLTATTRNWKTTNELLKLAENL